ncbi:MAG: coproporphyrinogen oxidase, anaerobic, partial [Candidatus Solibacter sp.]|nr:coproporphyrinogen oxidase, anaerobic [Candidatus Solibacter sp.]
SNFARPGFESRHNLKYWRLDPYVGFGADAHSFDGRTRHQNPETVTDYLAGTAQVDDQPHLADERLFIGLRLSAGVRPDAEEWRRFDAPIHRFLKEGLLESADGVLRLTDRGVLLSNEVFQEFLQT